MNLRVVAKLLGIVSFLIGGTMLFSLPWAIPWIGQRTHPGDFDRASLGFETSSFFSLLGAMIICMMVGAILWWFGKTAKMTLYRKEAMAVVGLSWVLATILGALPYYFYGVRNRPSVRLVPPQQALLVRFAHSQKKIITPGQQEVLEKLLSAGAAGVIVDDLTQQQQDSFHQLMSLDPDWRHVLKPPEDNDPRFAVTWVPMGITDCLFESQSGFSTTGATVISDLENPNHVPYSILFWRSSTHFLGGLGIIVLFVAILGQGSAGKALMRAEVPGPSKDGSLTRMQHTAWLFTAIYCGLTLLQTIILKLQGLSLFDAICHAFGTLATGGFSTYNRSIAAFDNVGIEINIIVFMVLAGTNFTLLYFLIIRHFRRVFLDVEWQTYMLITLGATAMVVIFGRLLGDFSNITEAIRYGLFQVVAILTTTGYGTNNFDAWNNFGRGALFLLMFIGGCAGSTGGGMKVIRHILFHKILWMEIEQSYRPTVVRPLRLGGTPVDNPELRHYILVYFGLVLAIFTLAWMFLVTVEPSTTWGSDSQNQLIDSASAIAATLNNIGPGLGVIGTTQNYSEFSPVAKLLFTWLMMLGRLEIFVILMLFDPRFWKVR